MAGPGIKNEKERLIEEILITNYEKYYRLAYGYVHNDADAMDIVQEGAYKAILKSETLRELAYAATWVYRIMLNEVFQFCRDNAKRRSNENGSVEDWGKTEPTEEMAYMDFLELYDALGDLETNEKLVLKMKYFDGMKLWEVAQKLNLNENTVKSRLYRAIAKLRKAMSGQEA